MEVLSVRLSVVSNRLLNFWAEFLKLYVGEFSLLIFPENWDF